MAQGMLGEHAATVHTKPFHLEAQASASFANQSILSVLLLLLFFAVV